MKTPVSFNVEDYSQVPAIYPAEGHERPGVKAIYFENEKYHGKETRVFAWVGLPYLEKGATCPAMVLLHGGGGTALDEWVRIWNRKGYAAIAIDQCGCKPEIPVPIPGGVKHEKNDYPGPDGWDASFHQMDEDVEEHWQYHAITALLRAHTIIASYDEVDSTKIGITGVSWGGYMTSLMMGIDSRYAVAIPVYGCGFITENSHWNTNGYDGAKPEHIKRWTELWEPMHYIGNTKAHTLWVNGTNDFAYPIDSFKKSYSLTPSPVLAIIHEMPHSHEHAWAAEEIYHFTDSVFRGRAPLPEHVKTDVKDRKVTVSFKSARPLMKAIVYYTRAEGMWQDRRWNPLHPPVEEPELSEGVYTISAELPIGTTAVYVNAWDDREILASSPYIEI